MCGIYSGLSPIEFYHLYIHNQSRGSHSSGFLYIEDEGYELVKTSKKNYTFFPDIKNGFYLGHNRAPTTSGDTKGLSSCHPFSFGRAIAAHNGILTNTEALEKVYGIKFDVDSQWIPYLYDIMLKKTHLNLKPEDAFRYVLEDIKGTYGIWLYDIENGSVFVGRGDNTIYWNDNNTSFSSIADETYKNLMPDGAIFMKSKDSNTFIDINADRRLKREQKYFMI
jgi:glucosamine 6-phosphate synthetase-like amidotransferase/phosphosugar isomerase protein